MYKIKMMSGDSLLITKEEARELSGKKGLVLINSLKGYINLSSVESILPEELTSNRIKNKDGQWCIRKFGQWFLESDPTVRVNLKYYPELETGEVKKQIQISEFGKKLSKEI